MDSQALALQKIYWNKQYEEFGAVKTDRWLLKFEGLIAGCQGPIIDLGCGSGNNVVTLLKWDKTVIPCDYSDVAIKNIRNNFPQIEEAFCFDMTEGLPFTDNFTDLVIADLSLHYFSQSVTFKILNEIKRVLTPNGKLLFRVNSMNDVNYGAGVGQEVERHYYFTGESSYKRFFDEKDVRFFWQEWELEYLGEVSLLRYDMPKTVWCCLARKSF